jgi:hypothetical protein
MEVSGQLYALATLHPYQIPEYPLNRRLDGPQSWSQHLEEEKNLLPLLGIELWIIQLIPWSLC